MIVGSGIDEGDLGSKKCVGCVVDEFSPPRPA
jgi:hypothetical protein